jgi:predicted transcriptional regulator YdeE
MKKELANKSEIKLVGLTARTNNTNEMNPQTSKIGELASRFWSQNIAAQIVNRKNPDVTLSYRIGEINNTSSSIPKVNNAIRKNARGCYECMAADLENVVR